MLRRFALPLAAAFIVLILVYFAFLRAAAHDRVDEREEAPASAVATPPGAAPAALAPSATPAGPGIKRVDKAAAEQLRRDIQAARERRRVAAAPRTTSAASGAADAAATPTLDKDYVRTQVRALLPLLTECYTHALERDPRLAGELVVHFDIVGEPEVGGSVDGSEIVAEGSTITDPEMLECVRETMYGLELAAPPAGGTVSITYPFAFAPDDGEGEGPDAGPRKEAK